MLQKYKEKYLCYIDILGFSNAITYPESELYNRSIQYFMDACDILKNIPSAQDYILKDQQTTQFLDCVAFSCISDIYSLNIFLSRIANIQQKLLEGGLPSRGAITKGNLFHNKKYILGPALIEAVNLERNAPNFLESSYLMTFYKTSIYKHYLLINI